MRKLIVLLAILSILCTGCGYKCSKCEDLELELYVAEEKINDLYEDLEEYDASVYGVLEEINSYLYGAEEYLNGQFLDKDPDEALRIIRECEEYIGGIIY